ncbi:MAG TPA: hypothetical protein VM370_07900 [Candidatus Thermoplasmatota archaeon]|nr:hypothetical protein [Candidatus Thermoplasmatota archaeon]
MRILVAFLLALPIASAGGLVEEVAYVVGTGQPNAGLFCLDARETTQAIEPPSVGGGCTLVVPTGAPLVVEAVDDAQGEVSFFYDVRVGDPDARCAHGFVLGPALIAVPPGCDQLSVHPALGSLSGVVRVMTS